MDEWKKFANTVKLRILTRQLSMSGKAAYIQTEFDVIAAEGSGFITDDVGINPGYLQEEGKQNPMWDRLGRTVAGGVTLSNDATCATDYIITYLQGTNDDRIDYLYGEEPTGHLGVIQGLTAAEYDNPVVDAFAPELVSNIGPGILKSCDMDAIIFTLAECNFNLAEAAISGVTGLSGAQTYYENGIQASFDYLGAGDATAYYSQSINNVGWAASTSELEAIITQKWIAVNGITAEQSWFDYNRTGFPGNLPVPHNQSHLDRPVRIYWPSGEVSSNGGNLPTQPDAFTAKIFWGN